MYSWETGSEERDKKRGKDLHFFFSPGLGSSLSGQGCTLLAACRATILRSVNMSTQHVITDKPSVKMNTFELTVKNRWEDLEYFHVVALITFLLSCASETCVNKKCWSMGIWSLTERTPLFLATEAMWDNISYYIFSEVIEAPAQRKAPFFWQAVSVCKGVILQPWSSQQKLANGKVA